MRKLEVEVYALKQTMGEQGELNFDLAAAPDGYTKWVAERRATAREVGRRLNLPVGHRVEVWLRDGVRLRGPLSLRDEFLLIEESRLHELVLVADGTTFTYPEIESCIRVDG